jgi:penicillin-binding protein 1A
MATAYSMLDNGGRWLKPSIVDLVQDRDGRILYQKGTRDCAACYVVAGPRNAPQTDPNYRLAGAPDSSVIYVPNGKFADNALYYVPNKLDPLIDPIADHQIVSMMEGVVQQGTGIKVAAVGKPLAGKTGTSSEWFDAWFLGFSPDIAAGVYVGFDTPRTLGDGETGGNVAAPIFRDFMADALKNAPALPFPEAPGAEMVLVNSITGQPTSAADKDAILEAFRLGTGPGTGGHGGGTMASSSSDDDEPLVNVNAAPGATPYTPPVPGMPYMQPVPMMPGAVVPVMPSGMAVPAVAGMPPMPMRGGGMPVVGPAGGTGGLY